MSWNEVRWDGRRRGFYEVYYFKANHLRSGRAVWLRYTLLVPRNPRQQPVAELWGIAFDSAAGRTLGWKETFPLADCRWSSRPFAFRIGSAELTDEGLKGRLEEGGRTLEWAFHYSAKKGTFVHFPHDWMYRAPFPKTKVVTPHLSVAVDGYLKVNGETFPFHGEPGQLGHLWGTQHGERWAWAHCNHFKGAPDAAFEGLAASIKLGGWVTPPIALFCFEWQGKRYHFNRISHWLRASGRSELTGWTFEAKGGDYRLTGEIRSAVPLIAGVRYQDPDGSFLFCHNTKVADAVLKLYRVKPDSALLGEFRADGTMAYEWVTRTLDPRVERKI
jgi:hypothetical protein